MSDAIFTVGSDGRLTELTKREFVSEADFQQLLANHPSVLGLTTAENATLLLIKREQSIPDTEGGSGRWSIDHLFLDSQGVPVLVEVKRATDTRARREVVAQMLDYAANGVAFWPITDLIASFEETAQQQGLNSTEILSKFLNVDQTPDEFWRQVEANLRSGRIRLVFVADSIPKELRRIVEFLNEQMNHAEVLAVEIGHYISNDGIRTLVPKLVGATERAVSNKAIAKQTINRTLEEWLIEFENRHGETAYSGLQRALTLFKTAGAEITMANTGDSILAKLTTDDAKPTWPFLFRLSTGRFETCLQYLQNRPAFESEVSRQSLLDQIKQLPCAAIRTGKTTGFPSLPASELMREDVWEALKPMIETVSKKAKLAKSEFA